MSDFLVCPSSKETRVVIALSLFLFALVSESVLCCENFDSVCIFMLVLYI